MTPGHIFKNGGRLVTFSDTFIVITGSRVDCDADGANGQFGQPPAYAPHGWGPTLDDLSDAGHPGNWYGIVTDSDGNPVVQGADDPCPGAYVSTTSLHLPNPDGTPRALRDPFKYLDAATVPFLVIDPQLVRAVGPRVMGCRAVLQWNGGPLVEFVVGDSGNTNEMGENSYAGLKALGIKGDARAILDTRALLTIEIYPGTPAVVNGVTYPLQPE